MTATPALWPTIQHALETSRFFILLASPAAARSPWVDQELAWWMQHREPETLLVVLTTGIIVWDGANADFEWRSTDALPRRLSGWFRAEPLWVDLRWARESVAVDPLGRSVAWTDGSSVVCWDLRDNRLGSVVHPPGAWSVAFTSNGSMLVVSTDEGLAVSPTPAGCPAAEPLLRVRGSGADAQGLWPFGGTRILTWGGADLPQLVDLGLGREIRSYQAKLGSSEDLGDVAVSSDGQTFAVTVSNGDILWYDVKTGARIGVVHTGTGSPGALAFVPGSRRVARTTATTVQLWDPSGHLAGQFDGSAQQLRFSADGQLLFGLDNEEVLRVWDVPSRSQLGTLQALPLVDDRGDQTAGGAEYGLRTAMGSGPDGTLWFVAASAQPTSWTFSIPAWSRLACTWAARSLSPEEWLHYVGTTPPADLSCAR